MPNIKISNMVKFYTLVLLSEKPCDGYDLMKEIGSKLDQRVSPGQMYPFLAQLEKNGFVTAGKKGAREKVAYALTPEGKKFAQTMLARFGSLIEIALSPRLTVCTHCGCRVFDGEHTERIGSKTLKFCCGHCAASYAKDRSGSSMPGHEK